MVEYGGWKYEERTGGGGLNRALVRETVMEIGGSDMCGVFSCVGSGGGKHCGSSQEFGSKSMPNLHLQISAATLQYMGNEGIWGDGILD
ncbi:hypothetical protein WN943_025969 [Citrus x changshan-huyou]